MRIRGIIISAQLLFAGFSTAHATMATPEHLIYGDLMGARDFYLYAPKKPDGLVVMLHGCKTDAAQFDQGTEMSKYAEKHNLAVLYPEQSVLANSDHCWNWFWGTETSIIAEGIIATQLRFNLDREHTYLMGMSAGAAQGAILANCNRDLFSKVLLHSGLQYLAATSLDQANDSILKGSFTSVKDAANLGLACNFSTQKINFMIVYGTLDVRVNPINSQQNADELTLLNQLLVRESNQAGIATTSTAIVPADGTKLGYQTTNISIDGDPTGQLIEITGLAHEWSGGNPVQPRNNPNGPSVIDLFFQKSP